MFASPPAVTVDGALSYAPAANRSGIAVISVILRDDGGTANGGRDASVPQTFTITVTNINDPPTFVKGADQTVLEDAGMITRQGWALDVTRGAPDESDQTLTFTVSVDNPGLFASVPAISADGTLRFESAPNVHGTATVTVALQDDGGTANGGVDRTTEQSFIVTVTSVNDAPTFTAGPGVSSLKGSGTQTFPNWATNILAGASDESSQQLSFEVTPEDPAFFSVAPSITADGTLSFAVAPNGSTSSAVTVVLKDDGGIADGGADTSSSAQFVVSTGTIAEQVGTYAGLIRPIVGGTAEGARTGSLRMNLGSQGGFSGKLVLAGKRFSFKGGLQPDGKASFGRRRSSTLELKRRGKPPIEATLALAADRGFDTLSGRLTEAGAEYAVIEADRSLYSSKRRPRPPYTHAPAELTGSYTLVFPALPATEQGLPETGFPQGFGYGRMKVSRGGEAKFVAALADGSKVSGAMPIAISGRYPLYGSIGRGTDSIVGFANFRDVPAISDVDADEILWFKSASNRKPQYSSGWASGIRTSLVGSKYAKPGRRSNDTILPGLPPADSNGNATIVFSGAGLDRTFPLAIDTRDRVDELGADLKVKLSARSGLFSGGADLFGARRKTKFGGAVLQKQQIAAGFFLGATESGSVVLQPDQGP
jgi:hypothetical protein